MRFRRVIEPWYWTVNSTTYEFSELIVMELTKSVNIFIVINRSRSVGSGAGHGSFNFGLNTAICFIGAALRGSTCPDPLRVVKKCAEAASAAFSRSAFGVVVLALIYEHLSYVARVDLWNLPWRGSPRD